MAKENAKKSGVTVETFAPKKVKEQAFIYGNIVIPAEFTLDRQKFDKMFKGKISVDINTLWKSYQSWVRRNS